MGFDAFTELLFANEFVAFAELLFANLKMGFVALSNLLLEHRI